MYDDPSQLRVYIQKLATGDVSHEHAKGLVAEWNERDLQVAGRAAQEAEAKALARNGECDGFLSQQVQVMSEREWTAFLIGVLYAAGHVMFRARDRRWSEDGEAHKRAALSEQAYFIYESVLGNIDSWRRAGRCDGPDVESFFELDEEDDETDFPKHFKALLAKYFPHAAPR